MVSRVKVSADGHGVGARVQEAVNTLNIGQGWYPAIDTDGGIRDAAWVAEAADLVNLVVTKVTQAPTPCKTASHAKTYRRAISHVATG